MVVKLQDFRTFVDGTVRDANNNIVQFMYGGDGLDPKRMIYTKGVDFPFAVNTAMEASRLNSKAEKEGNSTTKRGLTKDEVNLLVSYISSGCPGVQTEVTERATYNLRVALRVALGDVSIYPSEIPQFCKLVRDRMEIAKIAPGSLVGIGCASALGEPSTQMSVLRDEKVIVLSNKRSKYFCGSIGDFIDNIIDNADVLQWIDIDSDVVTSFEDDYYIMTVDPQMETTAWSLLTEVSRHPANGKLMRVKTKSGRSVTTTLTHSHLKKTPSGIVPVEGSKLKIGDRIPVIAVHPLLSMEDTVIIGNQEINLDFDFGWFIGAYLSEGHFSGNLIKITNISDEFKIRIEGIADLFGTEIKIEETLHSILGSKKKYPGITRSFIHKALKQWLLKEFGTGSFKKRVSPFVYTTNASFICGLLRGYFDGDGNVNAPRQLVRVGSVCKDLSEQVALLLSTLGILTTQGVENEGKEGKNPFYTVKLLRKHIPIFLEKVGSDFEHKRRGMEEICDYLKTVDTKDETDCIPALGDVIAEVAKPLKLPDYDYSRTYKRWTKKASIGRETLRKYVETFAEHGVHNEILNTALSSEVMWDEITDIQVLDDPNDLVYDFGVNGNHTFALQSGILVHNTLNTFHSSGLSAKDVTLGVPRFKELLNTTKKPSKPGCTVFFDSSVDTSTLESVQAIGHGMEEVTVRMFLKENETELRYLSVNGVVPMQSPLGLITYKEYEESWWTTLHKSLHDPPEITPENWVIILHFDLDKLYKYRVTLEDIARRIEQDSPGTFGCIPSPTSVGCIEVYLNYASIKSYVRSKIDLPEEESEVPELITADSIDFFTAREVAMDTIRNTRVQGIYSITKTYPREDPQTKSWFLDTQGSNLMDILTSAGVDTTKTLSDNMWEIYGILGIEAARTFLIRETTKIISFDGTYVNPRHFALLVESMTRTGVLTSVNRDGIPRDVGPLAKGMFEKAVDNFAEASAFTENDLIKGVAGAVMMGTTADKAGTGSVEVKDAEKMPSRVAPTLVPKVAPKVLPKKIGGNPIQKKGRIVDAPRKGKK